MLPQELLALAHDDFRGRNIVGHDGQIRAIIDWGFAGSYPSSELLGGVGSDLFGLEDDILLEYRRWSDEITDMVAAKERSMDWNEDQVALLVGAGKREVQQARREIGRRE